MFDTSTRHIAIAGTLLGATLALSGCVIESAEPCYEECYYDVYCDPWGCWEEEVCECVEYYYEDPYYDDVECYGDADCPAGYGCYDGWCEAYAEPEPTPGTAGFCQACVSSSDCLEPDALCIELNGSDEIVCGRACEADADCPTGFECLDLSDQDGVANQCVPIPDDATGARSCRGIDQPECREDRDCPDGYACTDDGACAPIEGACRLNSDCAADEVCTDGVCAPASQPECREDRDCPDGQLCAEDGTCAEPTCEDPSFDCLPTCDEAADCPEGHTCNDEGACVEADPPRACTDDAECEGAICLDGVCAPPQCATGADCGEAGLFLCVGGHCKASCGADADCGEGLICRAPGFCDTP